jgi:predicted NACHT family NTPase
MAIPTLRILENFRNAVKQALQRKNLTKQELARKLNTTRWPVENFFKGKSIEQNTFIAICEELDLNWQEVAGLPEARETSSTQEKLNNGTTLVSGLKLIKKDYNIDALVQEVRQLRYDKIQEQCGTMRMLDIAWPVEVVDIYTEVNILEEIIGQQWREITDFVQAFDPESDDFNRLGLGRIRQKRVPGLLAVEQHLKLMVLGKPGSGKTTFLKYVATQCNEGEFQADKVPIFIQLKNFAKDTRNDDSELRLLNYISSELTCCGIENPSVSETILNQGRALILLDGLDEVLEKDDDEVVSSIRRLVNNFPRNKFIITCRIAAFKYRFSDENFTEVEVADFNSEQVEIFAQKWFLAATTNEQEVAKLKAKEFFENLNLQKNKPIRDLAVTPLLLNLACLVFKGTGSFPSKRYQLYKQGINILLERWDEFRNIERDEVYRNFSLTDKINLLIEVAKTNFEKDDYFFEQNHIESLISEYLKGLTNAPSELVQLELDSEVVLKAIEAQHGLLVERARGIYSFSHLTFQEYFTARWFDIHSGWQNLVKHISKKRWREVFLLATEMTNSADDLLRVMKQEIDTMIAADKKLQQFLVWVSEKAFAASEKLSYKPAALRAFYFSRALMRSFDDPIEVLHDSGRTQTLWHSLVAAQTLNLDEALEQDLTCVNKLTRNLSKALNLVREDERAKKLFAFLDYSSYEILLIEILPSVLEIKDELERLELDSSFFNQRDFINWWQEDGQIWAEKVLSSIERTNILNNSQESISKSQKELLQQYYDANFLLADCLKGASHVSSEVREEIEEMFLLPISQQLS